MFIGNKTYVSQILDISLDHWLFNEQCFFSLLSLSTQNKQI